MLKTRIPKSRYNTTDYPNLEDRADGMVIPELYGYVQNITPVCINTTTLEYKIANREIKSIESITADGEELDASYYTASPSDATFTLDGTPKLSANTTYYIVMCSDSTIDGVNYISVQLANMDGSQERVPVFDEAPYSINGADVWSELYPGTNRAFLFQVWGKYTANGSEQIITDQFTMCLDGYKPNLRDHADRTKLAQTWITPAGDDFYITRVRLRLRTGGTAPDGNYWIEIHSDQVGTQVGSSSLKLDDSDFSQEGHWGTDYSWKLLISPSEVFVDAKGYMDLSVDSSNKYLDFDDGGGEETVTLTEATTYTGADLATEIETQMNIATADTITVSYSETTNKFTIASDGGTLELLWKTGTHGTDNDNDNIGSTIGFTTTADDTGATSYASDNEVEAMTNVARIIEHCMENVVGVDSADINDTALAALEAARTEDLAMYLDKEISFQEWIEQIEAGQLMKFIPTLGGQYSFTYYQAGEPAGTPHLKDEDFLSFKCYRDPDSVIYKCLIKYCENPTDQTYAVESDVSNGIANNIYKNNETLEVTTYLKDSADAIALASSYVSLCEYPKRAIEFEMSGYGFDQNPTEKVKITRTRGDNSGGSFSADLFRILSVTKSLKQGTTKIVAVLDTQTY